MNKYEEALDIVKDSKHCKGCIGDCNKCEYHRALDLLENVVYEYKELKERATPKKILYIKKFIIDDDGDYVEYSDRIFYECPICNERVANNGTYNYCPKCGQALDWR